MIKRTDITEFKEFLSGDIAPPPELEKTILSSVKKEMNPSLPLTISKLFLFHLLGSFLTLLFCPQFGISITGFSGIMMYVMQIHPALCFLWCGVMWMLVGQVLTYALLTWDEQRIIGQTRWGFGFGIMVLTVLVFGCLGRVDLDWWLGIWALGGIGVVSLFNIRLDSKMRRLTHLQTVSVSNKK